MTDGDHSREELQGMPDHDILILIYERQASQEKEIVRVQAEIAALWKTLHLQTKYVLGAIAVVGASLLTIFLAHCFT